MLCPITCGCNTPASSQPYRNHGCPASCLSSASYQDVLASSNCVDVVSHGNWISLLDHITQDSNQVPFLFSMGSTLRQDGCHGIQWIKENLSIDLCRPDKDQVLGNFRYWCPQTCNCPAHIMDCPLSCARTNIHQSHLY